MKPPTPSGQSMGSVRTIIVLACLSALAAMTGCGPRATPVVAPAAASEPPPAPVPSPSPPLTAAQKAVLKGKLADFVAQFETDTGIKLVPIPAGTFSMGSPPDDRERIADECPQTRVTLSKDFFLGATSVTQEQWTALMGDNPSKYRGANLPVEEVGWDDAMAFCEKLTERERSAGHLQEGYVFTLPTEAQWEYACRAGTTEPNLSELGVLWRPVANSVGPMYPVGTTEPNAWGLFDMHNGWAWCADWYGSYPGGSVTDPAGPALGFFRVIRGGSLYLTMDDRFAHRRNLNSRLRDETVGFRLALKVVTSANPGYGQDTAPVPAPTTASVPAVAIVPLPSPPLTAAQQTVLKGEFGDFVAQFETDTGIKLVPIPAGTFSMGSPPDEKGRENQEGPTTRVTLTQDFFLGATEVTQRQWMALRGTNPSRHKGADLPVEQVSWDSAMAFCHELTGREQATERPLGHLPAGYVFTLPTEAQWEYACRAGTTGPYAGELDAMAWYAANSVGMMHPVGTKQPNAWGLFDMHGNEWEWCRDWFGVYPGGEVTNPPGPSLGISHVIRGGAWNLDAGFCRSAFRFYNGWTEGFANSALTSKRDMGFRVALIPPGESPPSRP